MSPGALSRSLTVRVLLALATMGAAYLWLHQGFATADAAIARCVLDWLGLDVSRVGAGLTVQAGARFDVHALVTGSCSGAAGAIGIATIALLMLPGPVWRRSLGALTATTAFVVANVLRIVAIVLLGSWLAAASPSAAVATTLGPAVVLLALALLPGRAPLARVASLLVATVFAALAFTVLRNGDYVNGMLVFHALAGPMLTFGSLGLAILLCWRWVAGPAGEAGRHAAA